MGGFPFPSRTDARSGVFVGEFGKGRFQCGIKLVDDPFDSFSGGRGSGCLLELRFEEEEEGTETDDDFTRWDALKGLVLRAGLLLSELSLKFLPRPFSGPGCEPNSREACFCRKTGVGRGLLVALVGEELAGEADLGDDAVESEKSRDEVADTGV